MPASSARRMSGREASSSRDQLLSPCPGTPKLIPPRQTLETSSPVDPSFTYSTVLVAPLDQRCRVGQAPHVGCRRAVSLGLVVRYTGWTATRGRTRDLVVLVVAGPGSTRRRA